MFRIKFLKPSCRLSLAASQTTARFFATSTSLFQQSNSDEDENLLSKYEIPRQTRPDNELLSTKIARLVWQSRKRGILETDLLLSTFATKEKLESLSMKQLLEYEYFLEENDWDIYYWLTKKKPVPVGLRFEVVEMLIEHSKNKNKEILRMPEL